MLTNKYHLLLHAASNTGKGHKGDKGARGLVGFDGYKGTYVYFEYVKVFNLV